MKYNEILTGVNSEIANSTTSSSSEVMSKPVISIGLEASVYDASSIMTKYNIRRLSITRDNILLGIVTATDLSRYIYEKNKADPMLKAMSRYRYLEKQSQE